MILTVQAVLLEKLYVKVDFTGSFLVGQTDFFLHTLFNSNKLYSIANIVLVCTVPFRTAVYLPGTRRNLACST